MGIIYREGRANADGKIPFPNSLDPPLSVFTGHIFDKTTRLAKSKLSLWNVDKEEIYSFIELANNHHPTIKFTTEVSEIETAFLDTCIYKKEKDLRRNQS